jgi:hypothetical protein
LFLSLLFVADGSLLKQHPHFDCHSRSSPFATNPHSIKRHFYSSFETRLPISEKLTPEGTADRVMQLLAEIDRAGTLDYRFRDGIEWLQTQVSGVEQEKRLPICEWALARIHAMEGNMQLAHELFYSAASKDFAPAQYELAYMYIESRPPIQRDDSKGFLWMSKAAELGDAQAQYTLGEVCCRCCRLSLGVCA